MDVPSQFFFKAFRKQMGIHTIHKPEHSSLRASFEELKKNPIKSLQWFDDLNELRKQAKSHENWPLWIEISNTYIGSGRRNSIIKESFIVLKEVLEVLDLPYWSDSDTTHLKLRGQSFSEAGGLYNALNLPDEAMVYLESAEHIAHSIHDEFLLVRILRTKEVSLNIKGSFQELSAFQLKNIEYYKKFVEKHPEEINTLILSYTNLALGFHNIKDEKKLLKYIQKAYQLLDKTPDPNEIIYVKSIYILLILDKKNVDNKDIIKAESLIQETESIDKTILDKKIFSIYLLALGFIQHINKDYQKAKKTFKQVIKGKVYSQNGQSALTKLVEIYHLENDLEGIQHCFQLQKEMLSQNYNDLKINEMAKQEAVYQVSQLKIEADYNQKMLIAERKLRQKIEDKQEKILNLNKELDFFTGMAAHDLKAPLRTIDSFLDLIYKENKEKLEQKDHKFFEFIFDATDQMTILVDKLLSHAKMGGIGITLEPIKLEEQVMVVKGNLQAAINEKNAAIHIDPLPQIMGESNYIKVLFQNLLSNAIKFTPKDRNPSIHIYAEEHKDYFCIFVKDNGIGIPEDQLENVVKPFYRLHTQAKYKGAGLGLATCEKIMDIHQGHLFIESHEGIGSNFSLKFPKEVSLNLPDILE